MVATWNDRLVSNGANDGKTKKNRHTGLGASARPDRRDNRAPDLTGARPGEVLGLRWDEINTKWRGLTIRDKVEGERVIPLTPYVAHLISALPRRNEFVFSGAAGAMSKPHKPHTTACAVAGIDGLSLHGLRRSFKSLTEWLEVPAGVVAQVMGHKPSATAEKHYTVRPLDLLRVHHERIEVWILEQAGVKFDALAAPGALRIVVA